jgi:hypothetical protein
VGIPLLSLITFGSAAPGFSFLYPAAIALGLGETLGRGFQEDLAVAAGLLTTLLAVSILAISTAMSLDMGVVQMVENQVDAFFKAVVDKQAAQPGVDPKEIEALAQSLADIGRLLINLGVGIITVGTLILVWLNLLASRLGMPRGLPKPTLIHWRSPEQLVWPFIAGVAATLVLNGWWQWAGANVALILAAVYLLQGLAVIGYYFDKKQVPRFNRVAAYSAILILEFLIPLVAALGLFDLWLNFRRLGKPQSA